VKNPDHAKMTISSAHRFRQSNVSVIRDNVFINPALTTKAETTAAYELRSLHRDTTAGRRSITGASFS